MAQSQWEANVVHAIEQIDSQAASIKVDIRPKLFDKVSNSWLLIDTGAACSVFPHQWYPESQLDHSKALRAVNGTSIPTFGTKRVEIITKTKNAYLHDVILAKVDMPVLGWDFIQNFQLDIRWSRGRRKSCALYDAKAAIKSTPLRLETVNTADLSLALVNTTFKNWSTEKRCYQSLKSRQYRRHIKKYWTTFQKSPKSIILLRRRIT